MTGFIGDAIVGCKKSTNLGKILEILPLKCPKKISLPTMGTRWARSGSLVNATNTWWMLRNCLVPRFQRMDATQLSCVSRYFEKLNIDLMLRQHYECAICAVICTFFITSLLSDLSVPCNYDMCIWYPYFNCFSVFIYFRACHNRSEELRSPFFGSWDSGAHRTLI